MDAISDVSRASQIFSAVPGGPPLPQPLDVDEMLGFNEALRKKRGLDEEVYDKKHLGRSTVFINHVDSFVGKHLVAALTQKQAEVIETCKETVELVDEVESKKDNDEQTNNLPSDGTSKSKSKKKDKSPTKSKEKKEQSPSPTKSKGKGKPGKSSSPKNELDLPLAELLEDLKDEETPMYDTSKLTVAEYYEMMDLEPGIKREQFLKDKFKKHQEKPSASQVSENTKKSKKRPFSTGPLSDDFEIIGTLKNNEVPEDYLPEGVSKIITISEENPNSEKYLAECNVVIYNIIEDPDQVVEASWVLNAIQRIFQDSEEADELGEFLPPLIILISSFMTWSLTKPLNPNEPELPFIEKDYRKRKPHPNYRLHFDLEEQVMKMNSDLDVVILTCGAPYGHEQSVFGYLFEMAFEGLDLPIFDSGNNIVPIIHVDDIGLILKEVLKRRSFLKLPFIFAKDPVTYSVKELVKAISAKFGTGCCRMLPSIFAFLKDEITQDVYDQTTANLYLESSYPLFNKEDIKWKCEAGFVENLDILVKEFIEARQLKPLRVLFYGLSDDVETGVVTQLSEHFCAPVLTLNNIVKEYIREMEVKIKMIEELKIPKSASQRGSLKSKKSQVGSVKSTEFQECQEDINLQASLEFYKKLNLKKSEDFNELTDVQKVSILKEKFRKSPCLTYRFLLVNFPQTLFQAQLLLPNESLVDPLVQHSGEEVMKPDLILHLNKSVESKQPDSLEDVTEIPGEIIKLTLSDDLEKEQHVTTFDESFSQVADSQIEEPKETNLDSETQDSKIEVSKRKRKQQLQLPPTRYFVEGFEDCKLIELEQTDSDTAERIFKAVLQEMVPVCDGDSRHSRLNEEMISYSEYKSCHEVDQSILAEDKKLKQSQIEEAEFIKMKEEEESILAINSVPYVKYLINYIYPTLTNALLEVTALRPDDPLDFIAEYLFVNNPEGHMMDPNEAKEREELMSKPQGVLKIDSKACFA